LISGIKGEDRLRMFENRMMRRIVRQTMNDEARG
jgi:hypothetical protein